MKNVFLEGVWIDENVIHVGNSEMIKTLMNDVIDVWLEHTRGTSETKRHDKIFEVTITDMESSLELIAECNMEVVEGVIDIYFHKIVYAFHMIQ